ncbi:FG-GAP-like repeat-containing protein [Streptomyces zaomyceticus]|uniref:FG-GAP-like repeat-containing protein n=1 Tax=Streptomyces zaomyceticus TaxID=68286 RepID=UPI0036CCF9D2
MSATYDSPDCDKKNEIRCVHQWLIDNGVKEHEPARVHDEFKRDVFVGTYGDSTSVGAGVPVNIGGYRQFARQRFLGPVPGGVTAMAADASFDYVGPEPTAGMADGEHDAHSGFTTSDIYREARCSLPADRPNVITLLAGLNDINEEHAVDEIPQRLGSLMELMRRAAPEAVVLLGTVTPVRGSKAYLQPEIDRLNDALPGLVREREEAGQHVVLVDNSAVTEADLSQDAHPGESGYRKMGQAWAEALMGAEQAGWVKDKVAGTGANCAGTVGTLPANPVTEGVGPGWRTLGKIASGMETPEGSTNLVELDGDRRADYLKVSTTLGTGRAALNKPGPVAGMPDWQELDYRNTMTPNDVYADYDGDGRDDLMFLGDGTAVWVRNGGPTPDGMDWQGSRTVPAGLPTGVPHENVRFADIDGDGRDDYLRVGSNGSIHAHLNLPTGWEEHLNWAPGVTGGTRDALRMADVTGDGKADYLQVKNDGSVDAYINHFDRANPTAPGRFTKKASFVNATKYYPADKSTFRDISGDGRADYVVIYNGGSIRCWLNTGGNM